MAVSAHWVGAATVGQFGATAARRVDWVGDTIKVALATSGFTPNQDTLDFFDDLTNEVSASGTGYTAGGVALASKTVTYDAASNETRLDAADVSIASSTITARYAIIYKDTGTTATSPVLGYVDFGADVSSTAGTFAITWDATGVLKLTAS